MSFQIANLVDSFAESKTLALASKAKKMSAEGRRVINFAAGEPDFNTPGAIIEAAHQAALDGKTKYTAVNGFADVREALAKILSRDYRADFKPDGFVLSTGGKQALYHAFQATLEPGDEVIIPVPYWTSFPEMIKLVGAKPVLVKPRGEAMTADELKAAITPKTKGFIFNSPANPHGYVYSEEQIDSYIQVLEDKPIWIYSDDTYYKLVYEPHRFISLLQKKPEWHNRMVIFGSASKSYAMTGWRIGWSYADGPVAQAIVKLQGQVTSGASSISQMALKEALMSSHDFAEDFRLRFKARRDYLVELLGKIDKIDWITPGGAFYCFVRLNERVPNGNVTGFCSQLLDNEGVCLVPGEAFGMPDYVRMSYALSEAEIEEGISKLEKSLTV